MLNLQEQRENKPIEIPLLALSHLQMVSVMEEIVKDLPEAKRKAILCMIHFFMAMLPFRRKNNSFEAFEVNSNVKQMIKIENISLESFLKNQTFPKTSFAKLCP